MVKIIYLITLLGVVASCHIGNNQYTRILSDLDSQLEQNPELVWDSLKAIDPKVLNTSQQAYYYLLNASAMDKNLIWLENDSTLRVALDFYENKGNLYFLARCQYYLGKYAQKRQQTKEAFEYFKAAETNFNQSRSDHIHLLGLIHYRLSYLQKQQKNLKEAEDYARKSLKIFTETQDTLSSVYSLRLIGLLFLNAKKYDEAKNILDSCTNILSKTKDTTENFFQARNAILLTQSYLYRKINSLEKSLEYAKKSLSLHAYRKSIAPSHYYSNIVYSYYLMDKADSAKYYSNLLINQAKEEKNTFNIINGYKILSKIEYKDQNYQKAFQYLSLINNLKDTLAEKNRKANIFELEKKYNDSKTQRILHKAEKNKWQAYTATSLIVLILFVIGFPLYSRHRRLKMKYHKLSKAIKHTEWGFLLTKEFITENHIAYDELERMLNREKGLKNINIELYNRFHDALIQQKADYSGRLIERLTSFDGTFATKFQQLFPDFGTEELLMASMIHHQWKITDMTTIFHISLDALRKRKNRLAQKISARLKKEIDLEEYLTHL